METTVPRTGLTPIEPKRKHNEEKPEHDGERLRLPRAATRRLLSRRLEWEQYLRHAAAREILEERLHAGKNLFQEFREV